MIASRLLLSLTGICVLTIALASKNASAGISKRHPAQADPGSVMNQTKAEDREFQLGQKLRLLEQMVESSPLSKRVAESGNPEAIDLLEQVRQLYQNAGASVASGGLDLADEQIGKALVLIGKVSKMVVDKDRLQRQALAKYESAYERGASYIGTLKLLLREWDTDWTVSQADLDRSEILVENARNLAQEGDYEAANAVLDDAIPQLERYLVDVRQSVTLVSNYEFASPSDEFEYLIQRYQSYQSLAGVLLSQEGLSDARRIFIQEHLATGAELRVKAEATAKKGGYDQAIPVMEQAISELIVGFRKSGMTMF